MPAHEATYFSNQITFIRLPGDSNWTLEIRTYDGQISKTVTRAHGFGPLDEYVLGENLDVFVAVTENLARRVEGLQQRIRDLL